MNLVRAALCSAVVVLVGGYASAQNLAQNPSFEEVRENDAQGQPFPGWWCNISEGQCEFQASPVAHSGKHSALLIGRAGPKMRIQQTNELEPGRYRITAFLRGLDLGKGVWNTTTEFMFDGTDDGKGYYQLEKNGTFGWTKLTFVGQVKEKRKVLGPSFGNWAPGYLWVDDVTLEKVGDDVALTPKPLLESEEAPIAPPGRLDGTAVRCPECGYRNMPAWKTCFACGMDLARKKPAEAVTGPPVKLLTSFEADDNPFSLLDGPAKAVVVPEHATDGKMAMRLDASYDNAFVHGQSWVGYDYFKADVYCEAKAPMSLGICIVDMGDGGYWTWVNYQTMIPPGPTTVVLPLKNLCVGEKTRPGRLLDLRNIKRYAFIIDDKPPSPVWIDNIRLERDDQARKAFFDGLYAFSFHSSNASPVLDGFQVIVPTTLYSEAKGYGLKNLKGGWGTDLFRPDPLYQDFFCIQGGGFALDLPNGKYRVVTNTNRPCGFWGEIQRFGTRAILAQGKTVYSETWDEAEAKKRYFRHWDQDDLPSQNTFDKYVKSFDEKVFDVEVTNGQLFVEYQGDNDGCDVSSLIVFPLEKLAQGEAFLQYVADRRRFYFEQAFHRVDHVSAGDRLAPTATDRARGYVTSVADVMRDVFDNDTPLQGDLGKPLAADVYQGEYAPMALSVLPLADLGQVTATVSDLRGPGVILASAIDVGYVSYRNTGVEVYRIEPRYIMPWSSVDMPRGLVRRFWVTVKTPADARPGVYRGALTVAAQKGRRSAVPVELHVRAGTLDDLDIPAGPWGYQTTYVDDLKCLKKIREYGFNLFSSGPVILCRFEGGKPNPDYAAADKLMATAKDLGFKGVMFYGSMVYGYDPYNVDLGAMQNAGFKDYAEFLKALYSDVQRHAEAHGWIPYYVNLCDEPRDEGLVRSTENAEAYRKAFPTGPPYFTGATSVEDIAKDPGHFRLSKALHIADLNGHTEASVNAIHAAGGDWAFYNGGDRWTFGDYMYKAARQFGMKFRINWHWGCLMGDPYYNLDGCEDDAAWCNGTPDGGLLPSIYFERLREGLGDYRRLATLARLAKEKAGTPAAVAAEKLIADRLASFKLGQRDHDALFGPADWSAARRKVSDAIDRLRE